MCPPDFERYPKDWESRGELVKTPKHMNDDTFSLHMCLRTGGEGMPWFVSNDELRDHRFMMLSSRALERWKERKVVKFNFVGDEKEGGDETVFEEERDKGGGNEGGDDRPLKRKNVEVSRESKR